jgi:hypothetical protein
VQALSGSLRAVLSRIKYMISIDTRTLALFRVLMGLLILGDLLARSGTFTIFYTEDGVVPQALAEERTVDNAFSFFFFTTSTPVIAALFILHGLIAIQLILGYKTRIATIISFLFVISLDNHNPLVTSHADTIFRLLFFWAIFLPLGERWSIDAIHRGSEPRQVITNLASAAILFQMLYMYVVNGSLKTQSDAWTSGTATPIVFGLDDMTYFLANYLREYPTLLTYGGWLWFGMLITSPLLMILPGWPRTALAGMFMVVHASFGVTVRIGGFAWVAIAGVSLFLPSQFWDGLGRLVNRTGPFGQLLQRASIAIERVGTGLAAVLPPLRINWTLPQPLARGAFNLLMIGTIIVVYIVPSAYHLHQWDIVEREPSNIESRIYLNAQAFRVNQALWTVFAPKPRSDDRYYVFAAVTADGDLLDVHNDRPLTFERPYEQLQHQYGNYRERFYMNSVAHAGERRGVNPVLAEYICETYQEERGIELSHINMYLIREHVTLDTIADPENREVERVLFYRHGCGDLEPEEIDLPEL